MSDAVARVIVGLAGAVGLALVAFAREHQGQGEPGETVPAPPPSSRPPTDPVVAVALQELARWKHHDGTPRVETDPAMRSTLEEYWRAANENPDNFGSGWEQSKPWSAAFISYVTRKAVPGALLPNAGHWTYTRKALLGNPGDGEYEALQPATVPLPGDIVVRTRLPGDRKTLDDVRRIDFHPSHGDIVVNTEPSIAHVRVVGGNLTHSVRAHNYSTDANGFINDPRVFALLRRKGLPNA